MKFEHHNYHHEDPRVESRLRAIEYKNDLIINALENIMATKQEVSDDLNEIKVIVAATRGAANSAITLLNEVLKQVGDAAANATDLDAFRADLALIKQETLAEKGDLMAAVDKNPAPTP